MIWWSEIMARTSRASKAQQRPRVSLLMTQPREVGAAEFKARCLELIDEVEQLGTEITITRHRKPIARLVSVDAPPAFCGSLEGMVLEQGDLISPLGVQWEGDESNFA